MRDPRHGLFVAWVSRLRYVVALRIDQASYPIQVRGTRRTSRDGASHSCSFSMKKCKIADIKITMEYQIA